MNPDVAKLLELYGTAAAPHGSRTLRDHLIATYELLKQWNAEESLCLAGLFHSIYSTEIYTTVSATLEERSRIRAAIGERAEELAYLFCACDRQQLLENVEREDGFSLFDRFLRREIPLSRQVLTDLLELAFANALEQSPRSDEVRGGTAQWKRCAHFLRGPAAKALETRMAEAVPQGRPE